MQQLCVRLIQKAIRGKDLFDDRDVVRFARRLAIRAILLADILCITLHVALDSVGLLPYSLAQSLLIGTSIATVIAGIVQFTFGFYVGVALQKVSVDCDAFRQLSSSDPLTGLLNRRAFMPLLKAAQTGETLAILDIDSFKQINDTFGHAAGDRVIAAVSDVLKTTTGDDALGIARLGGEEFGILLRLPLAYSERRINKALKCVADLELKSAGRSIKVTLSAGLAGFRDGVNSEQVYRCADRALYAAKDAGRGCVKTENDLSDFESGTPALRAAG